MDHLVPIVPEQSVLAGQPHISLLVLYHAGNMVKISPGRRLYFIEIDLLSRDHPCNKDEDAGTDDMFTDAVDTHSKENVPFTA